ncbi:ABC transporter substrate-binding protein [Bradyrhizobium yuanmingense]|uniref:ABC transporter substrate-binding protein n=1 Tax=Bradyrhizobium yuanmingense TaxID=108015 RepID=UPI0023B97021|nr:ABC transporter substrate-binding protein [Bradyrhizobium yuanmingense]MDF0498651.1 ABC transporter substrate-binding protein [Bradyrhizobium yuanmingense]
MTKQAFSGHSNRRLNRRSLLQLAAASLSMPFVTKTTTAWAQEKLAGSGEVVVFGYGGSFTQGMRKYVYDPFTKATGINVVDVVADVAQAQMTAMFRAGKVDWDIAYIRPDRYPEMHQAGWFVPIDYSLWDDESLTGLPANTRLVDAVVAYQTVLGLGYDERAFPKGGPQSWADFWDVKKFPGSRGLLAIEGRYTIPAALVAAGVPPKNVWPLTDDKLDRAFAKLDEIKPHITKWWTAGGEPAQLLINREYAVTSIYDGRAMSAIKSGAPIKFIFDGGEMIQLYQAILKGGPNTTNAQKFLAFMNRAQIAAGYTQGTGYSSPNTNQLKYLPPEMVKQVTANPENTANVALEDSAWLAAKRPDGKTNGDYLQERWLAWRAQ